MFSAIVAILILALLAAPRLAVAGELEQSAVDAGFMIDWATRCSLPTAPIETGLDSIFAKREVAPSDQARLKRLMGLARRVAAMDLSPNPSCADTKDMLSRLGYR
jgi:hypothetical protein